MRCPFRFRRLPEAVLRCMSGAAWILTSTVCTASRAVRIAPKEHGVPMPIAPRGFPIVEQFRGYYAPVVLEVVAYMDCDFIQHMRLASTAGLIRSLTQ